MNTTAFAAHLRKKGEQFRSLSIESADLFGKKIPNQYAVVRALALDCIVETSVAPFPLPQLALCRESGGVAETVVDNRRQ